MVVIKLRKRPDYAVAREWNVIMLVLFRRIWDEVRSLRNVKTLSQPAHSSRIRFRHLFLTLEGLPHASLFFCLSKKTAGRDIYYANQAG
jgi:hypothetical protein